MAPDPARPGSTPDPIRALGREIDALLRAGVTPDPNALMERYPNLAHEVKNLIALRVELHAEALHEIEDDEHPPDEFPTDFEVERSEEHTSELQSRFGISYA